MPSELDKLIAAGSALANCAYNLSQSLEVIGESTAKSLKEYSKEWDEARRALVSVAEAEPVILSDENAIEDAAKSAFIKAQSVYRGAHDHFPLKNTWETLTESTRDGWRAIAYSALEAAAMPPLGTQPEPRKPRALFAHPAPSGMGVKEALDEGLGILNSLIDSIKQHGNYSPESTCMFIDQAGACIRKALTTLSDDSEENAHD